MSSKSASQWFTLLFALFLSFNLSASSSKDHLLDQMISAYGGAAALEKLNQPYHQLWDMNAVARNKKGAEQRDVALPDTLSILLTYPDQTEKRILVKNQGVVIYNDGSHTNAQGPRLNAMLLQRMRLYNPLLLKNRSADVSLAEDEGKYRLTLSEGNVTTDYYVDPDSHLISTVVGKLQVGGSSMSFRTEYKDYKMVEGVMLHHREIKFAGPVNTAIVELRETSFNPE